MVPEHAKDAKYYKNRRKNTLHARKSRVKARIEKNKAKLMHGYLAEKHKRLLKERDSLVRKYTTISVVNDVVSDCVSSMMDELIDEVIDEEEHDNFVNFIDEYNCESVIFHKIQIHKTNCHDIPETIDEMVKKFVYRV